MVVPYGSNGTKWMSAYHAGQIKGKWRFGRYTEPAHVAKVHFMVAPSRNSGTQIKCGTGS
jgi:hypothetical protein